MNGVEVLGYGAREKEIAEKLQKCNLTWTDGYYLRYYANSSGWYVEDIIADLTGRMDLMDYARLSRYYYAISQAHKKHENLIEAGYKIWGAITAILKYYLLQTRNVSINPAELTYLKAIREVEGMINNETLKELYNEGLKIIHGIGEVEGYNMEWYEKAIQLLEKAYRELNV